jgi:hypothetical protein
VTFNHGVQGSNPCGLTKSIKDLFQICQSRKIVYACNVSATVLPVRKRRNALDQENEHVLALVSARAKAVAERRRVAEALTADHKRGHTEETLETFVKLQDTIEAIDRALADEERMAKRDAVGSRPNVGFTGL